jgi:hypothetical protein
VGVSVGVGVEVPVGVSVAAAVGGTGVKVDVGVCVEVGVGGTGVWVSVTVAVAAVVAVGWLVVVADPDRGPLQANRQSAHNARPAARKFRPEHLIDPFLLP